MRLAPTGLAAGLISAAVASLVTGCGGSAAPTTGCAAPVHEALNPDSTFHLLPGAPDPDYPTDPPTSGPHRLGILPRGVTSIPIPKPIQVTLLERGSVILQWQASAADSAKALAPLAAHDVLVTVAPSLELPATVVATAWTWKLTCASTEAGALGAVRSFVHTHEGHGPGTP